MSDKDISLRSAIFLVIGVLLTLSLVICVYIVNSEKDLVLTSAKVISVKDNVNGTGKKDVTVTYRVDNLNYEFGLYYKKDININDTIDIYYHKGNPTDVQSFKTSYLIFACPSVGILLCIVGLVELFRKSKKSDPDALIKTQVISIDGHTQRLEILTDDTDNIEYVKSFEEENETPVKELANKDASDFEDDIVIEKRSREVEHNDLFEKEEEPYFETKEVEETNEDESKEDNRKLDEILLDYDGNVSLFEESEEEVPLEVKKQKEEKKSSVNVDDYLFNEDKKKEEVKETPKNETKITKVIPKYFYITGNTLVYEVYGHESTDLNLKDIVEVTRTINSEGTLIKILIVTDKVSCLLTNMNKINLLEISNTIHNKMLDLNIDYEEVIEYKEF